ncbi:CHAP domain-containing protein [Lentzea sp. NPDC005914]|uniref:CHAP domain-containing protein n=1 Tax=Lentzea sp. NPDC005914 TaxID=3154572 RepID=UPI0033FD6BF0
MRTLVKTTTAGLGFVVAAAIGVALLGSKADQPAVSTALELVAATDSADPKTREEIVRIAERELNGKHKVEGANNCNYYSGKMGGSNCQAWCADFTRYVWDQAGVKITGTNSAANSFRSYGMANKTWKNGPSAKRVKPGDAVTYRLNSGGVNDDHVGIVTKVDNRTGKITVISGNSGTNSDRISKRVILDPKSTDITGYASPVGKKATKPSGDTAKTRAKAQSKSSRSDRTPARPSETSGQAEPYVAENYAFVTGR